MLNLTSEAAKQVGQRASAPPASGFRFPGFAAHYQDYEPSLDHFAFMRTVGAFWSKRHTVVLRGFLVFGLWSLVLPVFSPHHTYRGVCYVRRGGHTRLVRHPPDGEGSAHGQHAVATPPAHSRLGGRSPHVERHRPPPHRPSTTCSSPPWTTTGRGSSSSRRGRWASGTSASSSTHRATPPSRPVHYSTVVTVG